MSQENVPPSVPPIHSLQIPPAIQQLESPSQPSDSFIVLYVAGLIAGICMFLIGFIGLYTHSTRISANDFIGIHRQTRPPDIPGWSL